ncbi:MAG: acyl carrier protein [Candidatus Saccharicenans sp.]
MIKEQIKKFLREKFFLNSTEEFDDDQSLLESGAVDSLGILEIVSFLENQFQLEVRDEELTSANLDSINKIAAFVERKRRI